MASEPGPRVVLTASQGDALENLAAKQAGDPVSFINISDARALERLGLAGRTREGWVITPEGTIEVNLKDD